MIQISSDKTESPIVEKRTLGPREVSELLSEWVPFLSKGFCKSCSGLLQSRLHTLASGHTEELHGIAISNGSPAHSFGLCSADSASVGSAQLNSPSLISEYHEKSVGTSNQTPTPRIPTRWGQFRDLSSSVEHSGSSSSNGYPNSEFLIKRGHVQSFTSATSNQFSVGHSVSKLPLEEEFRELQLDNGASSGSNTGLSRDDSEQIQLSQVRRKKDFVHMERISGKTINVLKGLELHTGVFNPVEQEKIVDYVFKLQRMGQQGKLKERTYTEPRKWMRGKGRVIIQFGCCYNYATDKNGNPPGILREEEVDPLPPLFKTIIKRLVKWHVLPPTCVPNSCIVNIYDEGDCISPHIDHHDFLRPFCTISFLTECNILFGENLKIVGPGEFSGPVSIPLPVGSVLILSGNGADIAKHSVPAVPGRRISITFRKMDLSKLPYSFKPDPDLEGLQPLLNTPKRLDSHHVQAPLVHQSNGHSKDMALKGVSETNGSSYQFGTDDFPPLGGGGSTSVNRSRSKTSWSK